MTDKPIWELPLDFCIATHEGRTAFLDGLPRRHRYGESLSGRNWEKGWDSEKTKAKRLADRKNES